MSAWMTSGKARLKARQANTFEKRAQQRARVMANSNGNGTTAAGSGNVPHRILRERSHPNSDSYVDQQPHQQDHHRGTKRYRNPNIEIISGERGEHSNTHLTGLMLLCSWSRLSVTLIGILFLFLFLFLFRFQLTCASHLLSRPCILRFPFSPSRTHTKQPKPSTRPITPFGGAVL